VYVAVMDQNVALILPIVVPMFSAAGHQRRGTQASSAALRGRQAAGTWAEIIVLQLAKQAAKGNVQAFAVLADRVKGRVVSKVEMGGAQDGAIPIAHLTPEENERRLAEILARHGLKAVPLSDS
jgi:hypothetical protein